MKKRLCMAVLFLAVFAAIASFSVGFMKEHTEVLINSFSSTRYTLSYEPNAEGETVTDMPEQQVLYNSGVFTIPENEPVREGYVFTGWSPNEDGAGESAYHPGDTYTSSDQASVLYAQWEHAGNRFELAYHANIPAGSALSVSGMPANVVLYDPAQTHIFTVGGAPGASGDDNYRFLGWASDSDATTAQYRADDSLFAAQGVTNLYAVWGRRYTLSFHSDARGTLSQQAQTGMVGYSASGSYTFYIGAVYTVSYIGDDYVFTGWGPVANDANENVSYTVTAYADGAVPYHADVYAVWATGSYSLFYEANGGTDAPEAVVVEHTVDPSHTFTISSAVPAFEAPAGTAQRVFLGWANEPDALEPDYAYSSGVFTPDSLTLTEDAPSKVLYAVWGYVYTLTYDANGAEDITMPNPRTVTVISASDRARPSVTAAIGNSFHLFLGWAYDTEGDLILANDYVLLTPTDYSVTLYGRWQSTWPYAVMYHDNAPSGTTVSAMASNQITVSSQPQTAFIISTQTPTCSNGVSFLGWATSPGALEPEYNGSEMVVLTSEDYQMDLYAVWDTLLQYKLVYNANGGVFKVKRYETSLLSPGATTAYNTYLIKKVSRSNIGAVFSADQILTGWYCRRHPDYNHYNFYPYCYSSDSNLTCPVVGNDYGVIYDSSETYHNIPARYVIGWSDTPNGEAVYSRRAGSSITIPRAEPDGTGYIVKNVYAVYDSAYILSVKLLKNPGTGCYGDESGIAQSGSSETAGGVTNYYWSYICNYPDGSGNCSFKPTNYTALSGYQFLGWCNDEVDYIQSQDFVPDYPVGSTITLPADGRLKTIYPVYCPVPTFRILYTLDGPVSEFRHSDSWMSPASTAGTRYTNAEYRMTTSLGTTHYLFKNPTRLDNRPYVLPGYSRYIDRDGYTYREQGLSAGGAYLRVRWIDSYQANGADVVPTKYLKGWSLTSGAAAPDYVFANGVGVDVTLDDPYLDGAYTKTLYPVWEDRYAVLLYAGSATANSLFGNGLAGRVTFGSNQVGFVRTAPASSPTVTLTGTEATKTGCMLVGWTDAPGEHLLGTGDPALTGSEILPATATITLSAEEPFKVYYPIFTKQNHYRLKLDLNGASSTVESNGTMTEFYYDYYSFDSQYQIPLRSIPLQSGVFGTGTSNQPTNVGHVSPSYSIINAAGISGSTYKLLGWATTTNSTTAQYVWNASAPVISTSDSYNSAGDYYYKTLYPVWATVLTYDDSVTDNSVSGMPGALITAEIPSAEGHTYTTTDVRPTRTNGFSFAGWSLSSQTTIVDYLPEASITLYPATAQTTLYAVWQRNFHLVYNGNGGYLVNAPQNAQSSSISHIFQISDVEPVWEGYRFLGWATSAEGEVQYQPEEYITLTCAANQGDITQQLYAKWEPVLSLAVAPAAMPPEESDGGTSYSVTFEANAGEGEVSGMPDNLEARSTDDPHEGFTVPDAVPTRDSYVFAGWNTEPDGRGTRYTATAPISVPASVPALTLYAQWIGTEAEPETEDPPESENTAEL